MPTAPGLRERKKQRTRTALLDAAARLFAERGYERTTVAEIAAAVDISPRTFFSYFPSKEDVLFADIDSRIRTLADVVADRRPAEQPHDVLLRAVEQVVASDLDDLSGPMASVRLALLPTNPALEAAALRRLLHVQDALVAALHRAYPHQLDRATAAAMVGALLGALSATAVTALRHGDDPGQLPERLRRATGLALHGITTAASADTG